MQDIPKSGGRKKALLQQLVGGYVNTVILFVQGLLLVPLYLKYIGAHDYGLWLSTGGILAMMSLVNFGAGAMITQRITHSFSQKNLELAGSYFCNGFIIYLLVSIVYGLIGIFIAHFIPSILSLEGERAELLQSCFKIALIGMMLGIINESLRSFPVAILKPMSAMMGMALGRTLGIIATLLFLYLDKGLLSLPLGLLVAEGFIFLFNCLNVFLLVFRMGFSLSFNRDIMAEYFKISPLLMLAKTGGTLSHESEPLLITLFLSPEVTTAYIITRRAADIVFYIISVINGSIIAPFTHLIGTSEQDKIVDSVRSLFTGVFFFALLGFACYVGANASFVSIWVGQDQLLEQNIVMMIGVGFLAHSCRNFIYQILNGLGDFVYTSIVIISEGVLRLLLFIGFLSYMGISGAPISFVVASIITFSLFIIRISQKFDIALGFNYWGRLLSTAVLSFILSYYMNKNFSIVSNWYEFIFYSVLLVVIISFSIFCINIKMISETYKQGKFNLRLFK